MKRAVVLIALVGCTDDTSSSSTQQTSCTATTAFAETVCICKDFRDIGNLIVGKSVATDKATLAVMGTSRIVNNTQVRGDFLPHGGLHAIGNLEVTGKL